MQPSSEPTGTAPGLEKRGFERSDRPLARRIDDQDSRHRRCARQSAGGEPHRRTRSRRNAGPSLDPENRATASSSISKSAASSPSFRRGQIARRRASSTSRSIASATSWNVSSTSSSTFAPSQPATKRLPETSSQASTSSAPWLGSNDDRPLVSLLPLYWRSRLYNHAAAATTTGSPTKAPAKGNTARHS